MATKTTKLKKALEFERGLAEVKMNQAFFNAVRSNEWVNADTVYDEALKLEIPPKEIARLLAPMFKVYRKAGLIVKGKNFALSNRSSRPLPWYQSKKYEAKADVNKGVK